TVAEPALNGEFDCSEQPRSILTALLLPYLRTGRLDEAKDAHRRAYRAHRTHLADLAEIGTHLEFCALTGNEARGVEILQRHIGWLATAPSPPAAMSFAASAGLVLRRAAASGKTPTATTSRVPAAVHRPPFGDRSAADIPLGALADELESLAYEIAGRFDA